MERNVQRINGYPYDLAALPESDLVTMREHREFAAEQALKDVAKINAELLGREARLELGAEAPAFE